MELQDEVTWSMGQALLTCAQRRESEFRQDNSQAHTKDPLWLRTNSRANKPHR